MRVSNPIALPHTAIPAACNACNPCNASNPVYPSFLIAEGVFEPATLPADVMKNVNKMQYGDLTEEQIAAARQRRSREMCAHTPATIHMITSATI